MVITSEITMVDCAYCGDPIQGFPFQCKFCGGEYCSKHRLPENHACTGSYQEGFSLAPPRYDQAGKGRPGARRQGFSLNSLPDSSKHALSRTMARSKAKYRSSTSNIRPVTLGLVIANVVAFVLFYLIFFDELFLPLTQINAAVFAGEIWRVFTSMFMHFGALHIFSNMFGLIIFGIRVEDEFGPQRMLVIYLGAGLFANLLDLLILPANVASAGASGCIFGLMGAYYIGVGRRDPRMLRQGLFGTIIYAVLSSLQPGVNFWAHLFGAIGGILIAYLYTRRR